MQINQEENKDFDITIERSDLLKALSFTNFIIEKRNVVSELSNVFLEVDDMKISIMATDMEIYIKQEINAFVRSEGSASLPISLFSNVIRNITDEKVELKYLSAKRKLVITGQNCKFELEALELSNLLEFDLIENESEFIVDSLQLARIMQYSIFSMSHEESRYNLNGLYLHIKLKEQQSNAYYLVSAATDVHRLSVAKTPLDINAQKNQNFDLNISNNIGAIIPKKTAIELLKIIKDAKYKQTDVKIKIANNKIQFNLPDLLLISKIVDGNFPDYNGFIPTENQNILEIHSSLLLESVSRVSAVVDDHFMAITIELFENEQYIQIKAIGTGKGHANEQINFSEDEKKFCKYQGNNIQIGCNPKYLKELLSEMKGEIVKICLKDKFSAILIKNNQYVEDAFVIMPVKV